MDGDVWFGVSERVIGDGVVYEVETNGEEADFVCLFQLDQELVSKLYEKVAGDADWEGVISRQKGLRLMRPSCVVEETFSFLCTSNNHLKRILPMVDRLAARGEVIGEFRGRELRRFPSLEVLAGISEEELRAEGFGYRGRTIPMAAREVLALGGLPFLEGLREVPYREAFGALLGLSGVGPKLADCICLFALGHGEAVPVDTHIWQQVTKRFFPEWAGKAVTARRYEAVGDLLRERFGDLAGAAHQMLFHENLRGDRTL